ncbi:MAG: ParB/RepB/Spo0J family partition protein [Betaproteobacteria bacterium]|nr:ParB/RepB/Spo0J family partition protein [Betaproteobacteria bacterium]
MAKARGLGRGLDALLGGDSTAEEAATERLTTLSVSALRPGKYQPRTNMHEDAILELAESIKAQGMIQPILARAVDNDQYEIIAGERRWRAAQRAGLREVPVLVRAVRDEAALAMALIENIQREDLSAIEEATGLQRLIDEFGLTHQAVAEAVGRSRSAVTNLLRLLSLPKNVQAMLADGRLDMGHARALLPLDASAQLALAHKIVAKGLSVRDAERAASSQLGTAPKPRKRSVTDPDVRRLETELSDLLGLVVEVQARSRKAGKLVLHYSTLDQLERVLDKLR